MLAEQTLIYDNETLAVWKTTTNYTLLKLDF